MFYIAKKTIPLVVEIAVIAGRRNQKGRNGMTISEIQKHSVVEKVIVAGEVIELRLEDISIEKLTLDEDNPRIRYRLKLERDGKSLAEVINTMPEVPALRKDIETNGGLRHRIIVKPTNDGNFKVVEGNVRLTCVSSLREALPSDARWQKLPARILPEGVSDKTVAILLSDEHVVGKLGWAAHEKAGQIYHMQKLGIPVEDIAIYLRVSKLAVDRLLQAYRTMTEIFLTIPGNENKTGTFSYFEHLYKNPQLRDRVKTSPLFKKEFCRWVGEGKVPEVRDLPKLVEILAKPTAKKQFEETNKGDEPTHREWFDKIFRLVEMDEPEKGDGPHAEFLRALGQTRNHIGGASFDLLNQLKEDEVGRRRIIETYEAMVELMNAVNLPVPGKKKAA